MKIIIDSNILFSALIKESIHRRLILDYDDFFLFPSFLFIELQKHKSILVEKSKMTENDFNLFVGLFLQKIIMVPDESIERHIEKASEIVRNIDANDKVFVSCVLAHPGSILWSNDKKLKLQKEIPVMNTTEFLALLSSIK